MLARAAKFDPSALRILKLCLGIALLWHWTACVWHFLGVNTTDDALWQSRTASAGLSASSLISAAPSAPPGGTAAPTVVPTALEAPGWGPTPALLDQPWRSQYLFALYWAVNVLTGLGSVEPPTSDVQCAYFIRPSSLSPSHLIASHLIALHLIALHRI
jgi:hypothetical protein